MQTSTAKYLMEKLENGAKAIQVQFDADYLIVVLQDGRIISVPIAYYPRLYYGTPEERENWLIEGEGLHWPDLDEDIRTADLLVGLPSAESQTSLKKWLQSRNTRAEVQLVLNYVNEERNVYRLTNETE